jgi:hypothetical protein
MIGSLSCKLFESESWIQADKISTGRFYHALGNVKASRGLLDEAFEYHQKARDHYKLTLGRGHHRTADTCIKLSDHYVRLRNTDMAL